MMLKLQKRLAASILRCSPKRVVFDPARLEDIKEAITKTDLRLLVGEGAVWEKTSHGVSRFRANKRKTQKKKGLRRGEGSRKGKATARLPKKEAWMDRIRTQRKFLKYLRAKGLIQNIAFKELYKKSKGGYFRSIKHIKLHIQEHNLLTREPKQLQQAQTKKETDDKKGTIKEKQASQRQAKKA
jgi:large subunit ribosomal protein L19e